MCSWQWPGKLVFASDVIYRRPQGVKNAEDHSLPGYTPEIYPGKCLKYENIISYSEIASSKITNVSIVIMAYLSLYLGTPWKYSMEILFSVYELLSGVYIWGVTCLASDSVEILDTSVVCFACLLLAH
jgi:hypothetical protein